MLYTKQKMEGCQWLFNKDWASAIKSSHFAPPLGILGFVEAFKDFGDVGEVTRIDHETTITLSSILYNMSSFERFACKVMIKCRQVLYLDNLVFEGNSEVCTAFSTYSHRLNPMEEIRGMERFGIEKTLRMFSCHWPEISIKMDNWFGNIRILTIAMKCYSMPFLQILFVLV